MKPYTRIMNHVGIGYDVHAFAEGRKLVLGGVEIAHGRGLDGHSDADVLMHAVCDAVLGAIGEGAGVQGVLRELLPAEAVCHSIQLTGQLAVLRARRVGVVGVPVFQRCQRVAVRGGVVFPIPQR